MTVRICSHLDAGAPVLVGQTPGSYINLLEKVLVDGYGSHPGMGWTKAFHTGNVAVFRNSTTAPGSTGMYLRIDDTGTGRAAVRCYKTMSNIDTGTDQCPENSQNAANQVWWQRQYSTNGTKRWMIIGDERTFYMINTTSQNYPADFTQYGGLYGAGDFNSLVPGNEWNYMLFGQDGSWGTGDSNASNSFPLGDLSFLKTMFVGRSQALSLNRNAQASPTTLFTSGSPNNMIVSPYTGMRHSIESMIVENRDSSQVLTGSLRGVRFLWTRGIDEFGVNWGKGSDDMTGPNYYQFCGYNHTFAGSILIADSDW